MADEAELEEGAGEGEGIMKRIRAFREGDVIPDGAKFLHTEIRHKKTGRLISEPSGGFLGWLVNEETVYEILEKETVSIYEVSE